MLFVAVAALLSLPLIRLTLTGELQARFSALSVFNPEYLKQFGEPSFSLGLRELLKNFSLHFSPSYLLVSGDANVRHSTQSFGEWGWLEIFGFLVAIGASLRFALAKRLHQFRWGEISFVIVGYLAGVLPAAMTWESNPHALRSIGSLVFLALGAGGALHFAWKHRPLRTATLVLAVGFLGFYWKVMIFDYPQKADAWFDGVVAQVAEQLTHQGRIEALDGELKAARINYDPMATAYYKLSSGAISCQKK